MVSDKRTPCSLSFEKKSKKLAFFETKNHFYLKTINFQCRRFRLFGTWEYFLVWGGDVWHVCQHAFFISNVSFWLRFICCLGIAKKQPQNSLACCLKYIGIKNEKWCFFLSTWVVVFPPTLQKYFFSFLSQNFFNTEQEKRMEFLTKRAQEDLSFGLRQS